jgi:pilus assembly protein CpaF
MEALAAAAGMPRKALHAQLSSAFDVVLHLRTTADGSRRLSEIAVLTRSGSGLVEAIPAVVFHPDGEMTAGQGAERLRGILDRSQP